VRRKRRRIGGGGGGASSGHRRIVFVIIVGMVVVVVVVSDGFDHGGYVANGWDIGILASHLSSSPLSSSPSHYCYY